MSEQQNQPTQISARAVKPKYVKEIPISDVIVGHRHRENLGDIDKLVESIKQHGLINPIAVKETVDNRFQLLAGGRRLVACKKAGYTTIHANVYDINLDQLQRNLIELCENIDRKDMTYEEEVALTKKIHDAMQKLYGTKSSGITESGHGLRDTAKMLGKSAASVHKDIKLAVALEELPELKGLKNKSEAEKTLKVMSQRHIAKGIVDSITKKEKGAGTSAVKQSIIDSYVVGDFLESSLKLQTGIFDLIELDPPYACGIDHTDNDTNKALATSFTDWSVPEYLEKMGQVLSESYRLLKNNSWLLLWLKIGVAFQETVDLLNKYAFKCDLDPAIWDKMGPGHCFSPQRELSKSYETFLYARKGNAKLNKPGRRNVFSFKQVDSSNKTHLTEKPVELLQEVFDTFTPPGSKILIPFLGSGNSILAANNNRCFAFGYDLSPDYKPFFDKTVLDGDIGVFGSVKLFKEGV